MSKLSKALELLGIEVSNNYQSHAEYRTNMELVEDAEAELLELQKLQSIIKEFIAANDYNGIIDELYDENRSVSQLISKLCDIVGYSD